MNLLKAGHFKVGLMVVAIAGLIAVMSLQVTDNPTLFSRSQRAFFILDDAGGLVKGSQIKMAGIPVGIIQNISLQEGKARIDLTLKRDVELRVSAAVKIRSAGILGDKYIDVYPGSITDPPLENGGQIKMVQDGGSLDSVIGQIGDISGSLKEVAKNLKEAVSGDGSREHVLGRIVLNIEKLTNDLAEISTANKGKLNEIVDQVHGITGTLNEIINQPGEKGFKTRWANALDRIESTLKNIDEITSKVNKGEGTIGRLINDESTVEELNTAIEGVNGFLDTAGKTQTGLDFHSEYLGSLGLTKTSVGIRLQPGLDRYYLLGIVDDPQGVEETTDTRTTSGGSTTELTEEKTYRNKVKFNLLFAKNFYNLTVRGGIMENAGGVGIESHFFGDRLHLGFDALEFSNLNLRPYARYDLWKGIYLHAGWNDVLNNKNRSSNYLGVGLLLTNDDLKLLMTRLPM